MGVAINGHGLILEPNDLFHSISCTKNITIDTYLDKITRN